ncbi:adenylate/guanylate cyclase domain-containing protein [Aeromicrobium sp. 636]|uniref:Adenylate/guanylate cyclase domain-containing protein n=1 Tax=Aeromicrobium senzhongii TaxID=2663859 RepID=A0A8I0EVE9_9ACTN|nr:MULTISPECIES: adenylate/guanylate cyclase domain-containing protein [Aeromicrobium]MBC9226264.1 adenylate/guanylate cyclase domain-containing protein [Aeromicrobium senzhongii]MCQ3998370.1 adenylate/guanylate cyclase domain-containing protein [Aeromicrobium sp. 636]MTB88799.1 adenylate/guanylate cyclase domain-containing protein [Aeromicrobium senzhongii]QNL93911.1 adenylate/guanylate cyclase domain-containing protein [Aeromicrobium senzhongii]
MSRPDEEQLVDIILAEQLQYTNAETAERGGLTPEQAARLWRNLGFPDPGDETAFGDADVTAVAIVANAMEHEILDEDTVFRLTRALGQTMSRLADWQATILVDQLESDIVRGKSDSRADAALELAQTSVPGFERLMVHVWRRHLAAAAARLTALGENDQALLSTDMTVGFADMTRFTALSNRLDDASLASVVEEFETRCGDLITAAGARVIKTLGDAMLFVHPDPVLATKISVDIINTIGARPKLPDVRVGLATGSVISRLGDVFGPPVNLAARLSQVARANRLLVDQATADALGDTFEKRVLPPRHIKGFGHLSPITVSERLPFRSR